jgi:hypothetical protein
MGTMPPVKHLIASLAGALALAATPAWADDAVDPKDGIKILLKVLTYDVNFEARGAGDFVVLVASEAGQAATREQLLATFRASAGNSIKARPLKFIPVEFKDEAGLDAEIQKTKANAVLATPGISAAGVRSISEVAQDNQIYTLALDAAMIEKGNLAVGVALAGGRTQIVINEKASRSVGAKFETSVLKLARVIQ